MQGLPVEPDAQALMVALLALDRLAASRILDAAVSPSGNVMPAEALVSTALDRIGEGWEQGDISLAQVYMTAKLCQDLLDPYLSATAAVPDGTVVLLVLEDQHQLGARIVRSVLACAGLAPVDWGSMTVDHAIARVLRDRPSIVLVSTLMLRSALLVGKLTRAIREAALPTSVIVGGAPFRLDPELWREVGADAMGRTASDALQLVKARSRRAA